MSSTATLSIAILSGKGGVGKSNIALNLAYALHRVKNRVLLMDCDIGLANLDVLLGITPEKSLEEIFYSDTEMSAVVIPLADEDFRFIPAASGTTGVENYNMALKAALLHKVNEYATDFDYLILDAGAGIAPIVQTVGALAALRLVVITPEPTSLTDSYALMKIFATQHGIKDFLILVNQAESKAEETQAYKLVSSACERFLGFTPRLLGSIAQDPKVTEAVRAQKPFVLTYPTSKASKDLIAAAARLHRLREEMQPRLAGSLPLRDTLSDA